jgi:hypothetical protein
MGMEYQNNPDYDDHLNTLLHGKASANKVPDEEFVQQLEDSGFVKPFSGTLRRMPNARDETFKKDAGMLGKISVKSFVFSDEGEDDDKSVEDKCQKLADVIISKLKEVDAQNTKLKNPNEYKLFIMSKLENDKYVPLDWTLTDRDVSKHLEWTVKCIEDLVDENDVHQTTSSNSPWQATIWERLETVRGGFYTNWPNTGFNEVPVSLYGFPLAGTDDEKQKKCVSLRIDNLTCAFANMTNNDNLQTSGEKFAPLLVKSFSTLLETSCPSALSQQQYEKIKGFRKNLNSCTYFELMENEIKQFDEKLSRYALAFGDLSHAKRNVDDSNNKKGGGNKKLKRQVTLQK